ncbi:hypothetical protein CMO92_00625 [Candidatus Woesearchaeota archaeon]|nr:hypothetical protein [Candidatus Woesearchaeota archaeon]
MAKKVAKKSVKGKGTKKAVKKRARVKSVKKKAAKKGVPKKSNAKGERFVLICGNCGSTQLTHIDGKDICGECHNDRQMVVPSHSLKRMQEMVIRRTIDHKIHSFRTRKDVKDAHLHLMRVLLWLIVIIFFVYAVMRSTI